MVAKLWCLNFVQFFLEHPVYDRSRVMYVCSVIIQFSCRNITLSSKKNRTQKPKVEETGVEVVHGNCIG